MKKPEHPIVFFDGVCNLCNASVDFLIRHDKSGLLRYAPLQGNTARRLLSKQFLELPDSVILYDTGKIYSRSTAALRLVNYLPWPYKILKIGYVIPRFLRDPLYDLIAHNRYRWFGKKETCRLPTSEEKKFFLD